MKIIKQTKRVIRVPIEGVCASRRDQERVPATMQNRIERVLITRQLIQARVQALARQIARYYQNRKSLKLVYILEGAATFAMDLAREIYNAGGPELRIQSIKARTYGDEIKQEGEIFRPVKIIFAPTGMAGEEILIAEDIVDQGFTLSAVKDWLLDEAEVKDVKICALLEKRLEHPSPRVKEIRKRLKLNWIGFSIPDRWVAGYGVDAGEDFRALPYLVIVREEYYLKKR